MTNPGPWRRGMIVSLVCCAAILPASAGCQDTRLTALDFGTGSQNEEYLRALQVAGIVPLRPWSIRGFSPRELNLLTAADSAGPWKLRGRLRTNGVGTGPLSIAEIVNTSYPYGSNDGPVWAGRGLTSVVSGGVEGGFGPLSFSLAPVAFSASNAAFEIRPNGRTGAVAYNSASYTEVVDYPQRFGSGAYSRLDPGASVLRFDSHAITLGLSTANEWIGPATEYPFLLSNNAPGFPHIFVGTGDPLNVLIGRIHARLMWGKLYQSAYSPVFGTTNYVGDTAGFRGTVRLMTSGTLVFTPRGVPGLEIGAARFFHVPNDRGGPRSDFWTKPLKVIFLSNELKRGDIDRDNQLASAFFRWVFPRSGFELYGERGFEDHLYDTRDLILDPDHEREYMLGLQKILHASPDRLDILRGELVNYQEGTVARVRLEGGIYVHGILRQGHTNRGQLLGASPAAGWGAASTLAWTRYTPAHRTSITLRRIVRDQRGDFQTTGVVDPRGSDVI
ncbi:MAG TPA: hypothetical protein VJ825_10400, partial [Gemmatimonadaceae bacterium]|nr:hypothetical protein [Gemmatimonadaceae bacterium]